MLSKDCSTDPAPLALIGVITGAALRAALAEAEAVLPNVSADVAKVEAVVPAVEAKAKGLFARLF